MDRPEKRKLKSTRGARQKTALKIKGKARRLQESGLQGNKQVICKNETLVKKKDKKVSSRCRVVELPQKITYDPFKQQQQPPLSPRRLSICQIAPVKPMPRYEVVPSVENQTNYHQPVDFRAQPMPTVHFPSTSQETEKNSSEDNNDNDVSTVHFPSTSQETEKNSSEDKNDNNVSTVHFPSTSQETEKNSSEDNNDNDILPPDLQDLKLDWDEPPLGHLSEILPPDLQDLKLDWDEPPLGHLSEVINWLSLPVTTTEVPVPPMVTNIQEMMTEWEETHENKVQQVLEWLGYSSISTLGNGED